MCGVQLHDEEEDADDRERDARHQRDAGTIAAQQVAGHAEDRHRDERDHAQRRDAGEETVVEAQDGAEAAADERQQAGQPAQQDGVAEQRADDRELDDLGQIRAQREQRDREFGDVAEAGLHDADDARRDPPAQVIGALRDDRSDEQERNAAAIVPAVSLRVVCSTPATTVGTRPADQDGVPADASRRPSPAAPLRSRASA